MKNIKLKGSLMSPRKKMATGRKSRFGKNAKGVGKK